MNKIEKLIKELCPNGVEWKKLEEVCDIVSGKDYKHLQNGNIPVYGSGGIMTFVNKSAYDKPTVLLPRKGSISNVFYVNGPFWNVDTIYYTKIYEHIIDTKYLFYFLQKYCTSDAARPALTRECLSKIQIPLPPLPIQTEIVRILDKFVEQQEQLERLIELRKKQYEYYTHKLYSDLKQKGVNIKRLGDFCDLLSGNPFDSNLMVNDGIRLMRGMNIKRGSLDFSEDLNKYWKTDDGLEKYYLNRDDIVISMDGSLVGRSFAYIEEKHLPLLLVQRVARIRTNKNNSKYLYHYLANGYFAEHVDLKKTAGAIPHISMKDISSFQIPLPDIETQNAIVKTLDSFETSIAALTSALEASKNRYEYYRDEMMRF